MPCDVVVAGAGPAGAVAALILARAGVRVQLVDRARFPRPKLCGDTLNPGALALLAAQMPLESLSTRALPLEGMVLTGPDTAVVGTYGPGVFGRALSRADLDLMLIEHATGAGVDLVDETAVVAPVTARGAVEGVVVASRDRVRRAVRARLVIGADGRQSRLARALGLTHHPRRPRRWAIGAYFDGVRGLTRRGEMHVRSGHYIGVAPLPGGLANACLVMPYPRGAPAWRDPRAALVAALQRDARLGERFARARMVHAPTVLGPMAVEARAAGCRGLLLAGDAAGFIDPITGDGLRFAIGGGALAAAAALEVLGGQLDPDAAVRVLAARRREAFATKWRFNRAIRLVVSSPAAIGAAAVAARVAPGLFASVIRYAGDCDRAGPPAPAADGNRERAAK